MILIAALVTWLCEIVLSLSHTGTTCQNYQGADIHLTMTWHDVPNQVFDGSGSGSGSCSGAGRQLKWQCMWRAGGLDMALLASTNCTARQTSSWSVRRRLWVSQAPNNSKHTVLLVYSTSNRHKLILPPSLTEIPALGKIIYIYIQSCHICLSAFRISQKRADWFPWNFMVHRGHRQTWTEKKLGKFRPLMCKNWENGAK